MTDEVTERLKAIRKREQKALAGPWGHWPEAGEIEVMQTDEPGSSVPKSKGAIVARSVRPEEGWSAVLRHSDAEIYRNGEPTAEFISHSRTDVPWLLEMVETYRRALQEIGNEYIIGINQVVEEIDKPASEYSDLRVTQIRGMSLERISDVILDIEDDSLFDLPEES